MKIKIIDKYIFKQLLSPFFLSLFILVFVLLTQFLVKHLDRFLGKGLSLSTILKFIFFNSASIISISIPMAVLVATMMVFGRLSSDNEISGFRASGISYFQFLRPSLFFGIILIILMIPFNLWILPEMNHNIRKLSYKISKERPDIDIKEYMLNDIYQKTIYVGSRINNNTFSDIIIFNKDNIKNQSTILAETGRFTPLSDGLLLDLNGGSIHEIINSKNNEYRKTYFNNYQITIAYDKINSNQNRVLVREDREIIFEELNKKIKANFKQIEQLNNQDIQSKNKISNLSIKEKILSTSIDSINNLGKDKKTYKEYFIKLNQTKNSINNLNNSINNNSIIIPKYINEINRYKVELHKKFSIPFACLIFILLGIPLGIVSKRGSFSISIAISLGFFIFYWLMLTLGEYLGDEGKVNPAFAMWMGNLFIGVLSICLFYISSNENFRSINNYINLSFIKNKKI